MQPQIETAGRRQYLLRLRERAMERMRVDERAVAGNVDSIAVSRRDSLRWLGLAALAAASGARPLRALAEGAADAGGVLGARAGMVGSLRVPAPQYGVPALPQPGVPFEKGSDAPKLWGGTVQTAKTRSELGEADRWVKDYTTVVEADGEAVTGFSDRRGHQSRVIFYQGPWDKQHALNAISMQRSRITYIAPGGQSFYIEDNGELWAFLIEGTKLYLRKSLFRMKSSDDALADAIHGFVHDVSDKQLRWDEYKTAAIDLGGVSKGDAWVGNVSASNGKATIWCYSPPGIFTVDWKAGKLVASVPHG